MKMKTFIAAAVLAAAPFAAHAADYDWTGLYIGGTGGALGFSSKSSYTGLGYVAKSQGGGALAGFTVGYNQQFSALVIGLEADYSYANSGNTGTSANGYTTSIPLATAKLTSFGSIRARVGYAFDHTLLYATGGYASAHIHNDAVDQYLNDPNYLASATKTQSGSVFGLGIEQALSENITLKLEGLYANFSGDHAFDNANLEPNEFSFKNSAEIARLGIAYKF